MLEDLQTEVLVEGMAEAKTYCAVKKVFTDFFTKFSRVFSKFSRVFPGFRTRSDPSGPIGMHSDAFGSNRKRLDVFETNSYFFSFCVVFKGFGAYFLHLLSRDNM